MAYSGKEPRYACYQNCETIQMGSVCISSPSAHYSASISSSTDPFAAKTNKYAESNLLRFVSGTAYHIRMGDSTVGTAVTTDFYIPANTPTFIVVDTAKAYVRIIPTTGTAVYYLSEIY